MRKSKIVSCADTVIARRDFILATVVSAYGSNDSAMVFVGSLQSPFLSLQRESAGTQDWTGSLKA
jgi:hypothetical protein